MKTRQQDRYSKLIYQGLFLRFEAKELSKIPFSTRAVPYMSKMIRERRHMRATSARLGRSLKDYQTSILELYKVKGWTKRDKLGRVIYLPWKMYRDFEDKYKARFPEYESPWQKRPRIMKDFIAKAVGTIRNEAHRDYQQRRRARGYT